jgi:hypothetical protein
LSAVSSVSSSSSSSTARKPVRKRPASFAATPPHLVSCHRGDGTGLAKRARSSDGAADHGMGIQTTPEPSGSHARAAKKAVMAQIKYRAAQHLQHPLAAGDHRVNRRVSSGDLGSAPVNPTASPVTPRSSASAPGISDSMSAAERDATGAAQHACAGSSNPTAGDCRYCKAPVPELPWNAAGESSNTLFCSHECWEQYVSDAVLLNLASLLS